MIRVKLVSASRLLALGAFVAVATALVVYLVVKNRRVEGDHSRPKLQGKVVAVFYNTRYAHEVAGRVRFVLTSGVDKTYEDGTHELEQVRLESFGAAGTRHDIVTSDTAKVSDPSNLSKLDAEFVNNVVVQLSDGATVKTSYLHYDQAKNIVDTPEYVEFEGSNFSGHSTGIIIEATDERAQLLKDVEVIIKPNESKSKKSSSDDKISQGNKKRDETPEEKAERKARKRARKLERQREAAIAQANQNPNRKSRKRASKDDNLVSKEPTTIRGNAALLEKLERRVTFNGNVSVTQAADEMRADRMVSYFNEENHVERLEARGNSYLKQAEKAEVKAADIDFFFGDNRKLDHANASGGVHTITLGTGPVREAQAAQMEILFTDGLVDTINAQGNALIQAHASAPANNQANPTERVLSADSISSQFYDDGQNIETAEAMGNAVLTVTPVRAEAGADKKTIRAPRLTGAFFETGNRMKTFNATGGVRVDIEATVATAHPPRVVTSNAASADFMSEAQDVERLTLDGDVKYAEGDRNAQAERAFYNGPNELLNLRGKRPMAWDSKSRTQADEIDYDRKGDETHARGDVRTTYYSRESTNDATPFKNSKSPIFMTAERADARNAEGTAVYTGNARGWQDDNFVKGDRIELYEKEKRMVAVGHVESAIYKVKRETAAREAQGRPLSGQQETAPGFVTAERMNYSDTERTIHYEGNVKARQGTDRIEAESCDVFLKKETNEVDRMLAEGNVVLVQPGKRGTGDKLAYTSEDGRAVLTGKTARIDDREKGTTMGTQLTFDSRDDKISVENQQGTGRVRSTHRLTKKQQQ